MRFWRWRPRARWVMVAIALLAFALRYYRIGEAGYWQDEAYTLRYLTYFMWHILDLRVPAIESVPPLYFVLATPWSWLTGLSELALRFFSLAFGLLSVPLLYQIGRRLAGARVGALAALILALNPFNIWYSRDARFYSMAVFLALLSFVLFLDLLDRRPREGRRRWVAFGLVTLLGIYAHYYHLGILAAQDVLFVLLQQRQLHRVKPLIATNIAVGVGFGLWVLRTSWDKVAVMGGGSQWPTLPEAAVGTAIEYTVGRFIDPPLAEPLTVAFLALALLGAVALAFGALPLPGRSPVGRRGRALIVVGWLAIPILGVLAFFPISGRFTFHARYFIMISPPLYLLAAAAIARLARPWLPLGALALAAVSGVLLWSDYRAVTDPRFANPNYRLVAAHIEAHERPGDVIVARNDWAFLPFGHYYHGAAPLHTAGIWMDQPEAAALVADLARDYRRIWWLPAGGINEAPEAWLDANACRVESRWFDNARAALYAVPSATAPPTVPVGVRFGSAVVLDGYSLGATPITVGEAMCLRLSWRAVAALGDYKLTLRLFDAAGHQLAQVDGRPQGGQRPTPTWRPGEAVTDSYGVVVPPGSLPGRYEMRVGVYDAAGGAALDAFDAAGRPLGVLVPLTRFDVIPAATAPSLAEVGFVTGSPPRPTKTPQALPGGLELWDVELPDSALRPGDRLSVGLWLRATTAPASDLAIGIGLVDLNGTVVARAVGSQMGEVYPTTRWRTGEVVHDFVDLRVPPSIGGRHTVRLEIGGENETVPPLAMVNLGEIRVLSRDRQFRVPVTAKSYRPVGVVLGDLAKLVSYEAVEAAPGAAVEVRLLWQALAQTETSYAVFVHLVDAAGRIVAQHDSLPADGFAPTSGWVETEYITDRHPLRLPATVRSGDTLRLLVGLYNPATGQRLSASGGTADAIALGSIAVR